MPERRNKKQKVIPKGAAPAILGLDIVSYSELTDEKMFEAIKKLKIWIDAGISTAEVPSEHWNWSHGGDGGFLTFWEREGYKAILVGFHVLREARAPGFKLNNNKLLEVRAAIHAGHVERSQEIAPGKEWQVWGRGINEAARVLSLSRPGQLLISQPYIDQYLPPQNRAGIKLGKPHRRRVKHNRSIDVSNGFRQDAGLDPETAEAHEWSVIADIWKKATEDYSYIVDDALESGATMAAMAAAKHLRVLGLRGQMSWSMEQHIKHEQERKLFQALRMDALLGKLPGSQLNAILKACNPRFLEPNETLCKVGETGRTCFILVAGKLNVELPNNRGVVPVKAGQIIGEFGLWIPKLRRTATLIASESSFVLEIPNLAFKKIMDNDKDINEAVREVIHHRVVQNILSEKTIFPGICPPKDISEIPFESSKLTVFDSEQRLDLSNQTCLLFNGVVVLNRPSKSPLKISAKGFCHRGTVIGVHALYGRPTNEPDNVTVTKQSTAVMIDSREVLRSQKESQEIAASWAHIKGQREHELKFGKMFNP